MKTVKKISLFILLFTFILTLPNNILAHCDSYDGPVIKDAQKALEENNVKYVLKWVSDYQEHIIINLFDKTYSLKNGDKEIYEIVEKHFFETLVRLHRETEGAPYTGLKEAGTTKKIIYMSDMAIETGDIDGLINKLNGHIEKVVLEKYNKVSELEKVKDESIEKGREYVEAYVMYTHTLENLHDVLEHSSEGHSAHNH